MTDFAISGFRHCRKCGETKPLNIKYFSWQYTGKSYQPECKVCRTEYQRAYNNRRNRPIIAYRRSMISTKECYRLLTIAGHKAEEALAMINQERMAFGLPAFSEIYE